LDPFKPVIDVMLREDQHADHRHRHRRWTNKQGTGVMTTTTAPASTATGPGTTTPSGPLRRRRGMTEQAADAAVDSACRQLRLPTVRSRVGEMLTAAEKEQLTYRGFLAELLLAECDDRARRRSARRVKAAGFPRDKWVGDFDFGANPTVNPATIHKLATADWVRAGHPLCLIGDSGTGKSHLLIALGTAAAEAGYRVKYTLATKLVNELVEAADERQLAKTIARYGRVDLLCIDLCRGRDYAEGRGRWPERWGVRAWAARHSHRLSRNARVLSVAW